MNLRGLHLLLEVFLHRFIQPYVGRTFHRAVIRFGVGVRRLARTLPYAPIEMYHLGSDIWSQVRPSTGNWKGTAPATIIKLTSVPDQAISKREAGVPSISMAQPAPPKVGGHRADAHARLPTKSTNVAILFSWYRLSRKQAIGRRVTLKSHSSISAKRPRMAGRSAPPPRHSIVAYARWADYQAEWRLAHAWSVENRATSRLRS